jgi:hypothetical protein
LFFLCLPCVALWAKQGGKKGEDVMTTIQIKVPNWLDFIFTCPLLIFRLLRYGYSYRRIYLGEGKWTILDAQDFYRLNNFRWIVHVNGNGNLYAARKKLITPCKTVTVYMHREIMNPPIGRLVDHKNCDGLDNRRENLRFATHAQNVINRPKRTNTTSRFVGVFFNRGKSAWYSQITHQGKKMFLGRFDNEIDAAKAYDKAAKQYHGEFARLNFPPE